MPPDAFTALISFFICLFLAASQQLKSSSSGRASVTHDAVFGPDAEQNVPQVFASNISLFETSFHVENMCSWCFSFLLMCTQLWLLHGVWLVATKR